MSKGRSPATGGWMYGVLRFVLAAAWFLLTFQVLRFWGQGAVITPVALLWILGGTVELVLLLALLSVAFRPDRVALPSSSSSFDDV